MNAAERVGLSRARLRLALAPPPAMDAQETGERGLRFRGIASLPLVGVVLQSLDAWWAHHPLRPVAQIACGALGAALAPIAKQYPLVLVLSAGAAGGALAWSRPWRWIFSSALLAGLLPHVASRVVSTLPLETWTRILAGALSRPASERSAASMTDLGPTDR